MLIKTPAWKSPDLDCFRRMDEDTCNDVTALLAQAYQDGVFDVAGTQSDLDESRPSKK
jgi:hypothetical protein